MRDADMVGKELAALIARFGQGDVTAQIEKHVGRLVSNRVAELQRDGEKAGAAQAALVHSGYVLKAVLAVAGDLAKRVEALEARRMNYRGKFEDGSAYSVGDMVTHGGHLWHCDVATSEPPKPTGPKFWTLAVQRGRDGRDSTGSRKHGTDQARVWQRGEVYSKGEYVEHAGTVWVCRRDGADTVPNPGPHWSASVSR